MTTLPSAPHDPDAIIPEPLANQLSTEHGAHRPPGNGGSQHLYEALRLASEAQHQLELALWASGESIWEWEAASDAVTIRTFIVANHPPDIVVLNSQDCFARVEADDLEQARLAWSMHVLGNADAVDISVRACMDGNTRWLRIRGQAVSRSDEGRALRMVGTVKDITRYREAEESLRLMASAFASSRDAMLVLTEQWQIIEANGAFTDLIKLKLHQLVGESLSRFVDLPDIMLRRLQRLGHAQAESLLQLTHEQQLPVEISISSFASSNGSAPYLIATLRDIRERKQAVKALERMARQDALTQLPNRNAFQEELEQRLPHASEYNPLAVLFIDLDGFKRINDSLGHEAGDELLQIVAGRLLTMLSPADTLARWGGDEFVAMLGDTASMRQLEELTARLLEAMRMPVSVRGHQVSVSASIGIALAPQDGYDSGTLLRHADSAMYAAKQSGRDRVDRYRPELDSDTLSRIKLTSLLRQAAERSQLTFVAQPKVKADGRVVGCELLVRWTTKEFGAVSPVSFIPIAEETGIILTIGHQAIREAALLARQLQQTGQQISVAINLSPLQIRDPQLEQVLLSACREADISPMCIQIELTESAFLDSKQVTGLLLHTLKSHGFVLALDDFGTGYSSLSYLRDLPFDVIKIDRAFLHDIDRDERSAKLLAGIVDLCRALDMETVAEGLESRSQLAVLSQLGIGEYQGFYFHKPMAQSDFIALVKDAGPQHPA